MRQAFRRGFEAAGLRVRDLPRSLLDGSVVVGNKVVIEIETEAALAE